MTVTSLSVDAAEAVEAGFLRAHVAGAPAANGAATAGIGGVVVVAMRQDSAGYWNKALGFTEPVTAELVDEILGFYRAHGIGEATLQLRTETLPADWAKICAARGIEGGERIVKLARSIDTATPTLPNGLDVAPVTEADAYEWSAVVLDAFGFPLEDQIGMLMATANGDRNRPYAVRTSSPSADRRIVAGGNLYLDGEVAGLNWDATSAAFRRRGAQSALIAARIAAAREAGCRWVVAETAWFDETPQHASLNNYRRAGFKPCYIRTNWHWTATGRQ